MKKNTNKKKSVPSLVIVVVRCREGGGHKQPRRVTWHWYHITCCVMVGILALTLSLSEMGKPMQNASSVSRFE